MTHPKLLKFMGPQKMYPRRKTVESDGCKIVFNPFASEAVYTRNFFFETRILFFES